MITRRATSTCEGPATINGQEIGPITTITALTPDPEIVAADAGPGSFIVFDGVDGIISTTNPLVMNDQQTYAGACDQLAVGILGCPYDQVLLDIPGIGPTVEKPGTAGPVFEMAPDAVITGITFIGGGTSNGIETGATILANADPRVTVMKSETISNTDDTGGIRLQDGSDDAMIMNNVTTSSGIRSEGIHADSSNNAIIMNNFVTTAGSSSIGVRINDSTSVMVKENATNTNGLTLSGGILFENSSDDGIAQGNTIETSSDFSPGVRVEDSDRVSIEDNNITANRERRCSNSK